MLPPEFEYVRPNDLHGALEALSKYGEEGKVLAGGQSLIPLLKLRFASPRMLIDINRIRGLDYVRWDGSTLRIGACTRQATLAASDTVKQRAPVLAAASAQVADPIVRNWGTAAGTLVHADPAGDLGSVMLATGAQLIALSTRGERTIPADAFFTGPFSTALEPDELLTEIVIPAATGRVVGTYHKLERKVGDFATVGVAVHLDMSNGHCARAGIGLTAVGMTNLEATDAESALEGKELDDATITEAARLAAEAAQPDSDIRGSADYKRDVVRVFVQRALRQAAGGA